MTFDLFRWRPPPPPPPMTLFGWTNPAGLSGDTFRVLVAVERPGRRFGRDAIHRATGVAPLRIDAALVHLQRRAFVEAAEWDEEGHAVAWRRTAAGARATR